MQNQQVLWQTYFDHKLVIEAFVNLTWNWIEKSAELLAQNKKFAIGTVTNIHGSTPRDIGAKIIVVDEKEFYGTIGGGALEAKVIKEIVNFLSQSNNASKTHRLEFTLSDLSMVCGGDTAVLVEIINSHPDLYLFGAGHCGLALAKVLQGVPFNLHVIDERAEWLEKYPPNTQLHKQHWKTFINKARWDKNSTFVVIMTPGHCDDRDILELVINKSTRYLGMIGSQSKWLVTKSKLIENGIDKKSLDEVHCPIGFKIGGKSPEEIAISISAELISKLYS